jgi:5-methylcytosine-specific restriction endonuclease McrA
MEKRNASDGGRHTAGLPPALDHLQADEAAAVYEAENMLTEAWERLAPVLGDVQATEYLRDRLLVTQWLHGERQPRRLRRKIGMRLRTRMMERARWRCERCGGAHRLVIDHDMPVAIGGSDGEWNLAVLCHDCNAKKGARLP